MAPELYEEEYNELVDLYAFENSPLKSPGPSNLLLAESVTSGDSWSDENLKLSGHKDANSSRDGCRKQEADSDLRDSEENVMPSDTDSDDIKSIVEKLENVVDEKMKEMYELKKNHEVAILNFLKELPQETRQRVLTVCNQKMSEHKSRYESGHFIESSCPHS
ncbi:hypothetical protein PHJA_000980100 [Phtheirospermum japonicum]|uniref:Uncharacterized protein n=1 Tax=Phtheirospermum japonicum TaxID=374723 RepID=A0A830BVG2_9LAMI|nr:hypothetical protein PHJA_000980100 [Phtheirospermum japonicum]